MTNNIKEAPLVRSCSEGGRGEVAEPSVSMTPDGEEEARAVQDMLGGRTRRTCLAEV